MKIKATFLFLLTCHFLFAQNPPLQFSTKSNFKYDIELANPADLFAEKMVSIPESKSIRPPLPTLAPTFSNYKVDTQNPQSLILPSGTKIDIPAAAFLNQNGQLIQGKVDLVYREFNSGLDIMLSGIPMDFKEGYFESAAMFEIRASQNGEELFPNPEAPIELTFPSTPVGEGFSFYNFDEEKGEWIDRGVEELLDAPLSLKDVWGNRLPSEGVSYFDVASLPRVAGLYVTIYRRKDRGYRGRKRGIQFKFRVNKYTKGPRFLTFDEWKKNGNINWTFVGDMSQEDRKKALKYLSIISSKSSTSELTEGQDMLLDFWMEPDMEADHFLLKIATFKDTVQFPVIPYSNSRNDVSQQREIHKFYTHYQKERELRLEKWQRQLERYYRSIETDSLSLFANTDNLIERFRNEEGRMAKPRRVEIMEFGMCNIDRIQMMLTEDVFVECTNEAGQQLDIESVTVSNDIVRTVLRFRKSAIRVVRKKSNSAIITFKDGTIALIDKNQFNQAFAKIKEDTLYFKVNPRLPDEINKNEIEQLALIR